MLLRYLRASAQPHTKGAPPYKYQRQDLYTRLQILIEHCFDDMLKASPIHSQIIPKTYPQHGHCMAKALPTHHQNAAKTYPKQTQNIPKPYPNHVQHIAYLMQPLSLYDPSKWS